jgi:hypothetical protein
VTRSPSSDLAELSTVRSQLEELIERVVQLATSYSTTPNAAITAALYAAERALIGARRAVDQASAAIEDLA